MFPTKKKVKKNRKVEVILSTDNPCNLAAINLAISRDDVRARFDQIATILQSGRPEERLDINFEADDLTAIHIKRIFKLLDLYFYNATLFPAIYSKGIKIFFEYFPFNDEKFQACLKLVAITKESGKLVELHFMINKNRFQESAKYRVTNGIRVRHKLEAFTISALHEISHAIIYSFCGHLQGHGETFLNINSKLHGASPTIFEYKDETPA
jgi:hypothetical protein